MKTNEAGGPPAHIFANCEDAERDFLATIRRAGRPQTQSDLDQWEDLTTWLDALLGGEEDG